GGSKILREPLKFQGILQIPGNSPKSHPETLGKYPKFTFFHGKKPAREEPPAPSPSGRQGAPKAREAPSRKKAATRRWGGGGGGLQNPPGTPQIPGNSPNSHPETFGEPPQPLGDPPEPSGTLPSLRGASPSRRCWGCSPEAAGVAPLASLGFPQLPELFGVPGVSGKARKCLGFVAHRQRVREKIERDKAERAQRFAPLPPEPAPVPAQEPPAPREYDECRIQVRLPDGRALTQSFRAREPLAAVRLFVELHRDNTGNNTGNDTGNATGNAPEPFSLRTAFPRRLFSEEDMEKPLQELGLVPSAVIIVAKKEGS
ncbi:UBX domain-containing protein 1, partial [Parus major]|uniref:UBX domain-containing protein 1 n=1 Tax=Parus major TaxID=9157 RepID=UPI000771593A